MFGKNGNKKCGERDNAVVQMWRVRHLIASSSKRAAVALFTIATLLCISPYKMAVRFDRTILFNHNFFYCAETLNQISENVFRYVCATAKDSKWMLSA